MNVSLFGGLDAWMLEYFSSLLLCCASVAFLLAYDGIFLRLDGFGHWFLKFVLLWYSGFWLWACMAGTSFGLGCLGRYEGFRPENRLNRLWFERLKVLLAFVLVKLVSGLAWLNRSCFGYGFYGSGFRAGQA